MKLKLTFKSPDALDYALQDAGITDPDERDELYGKLCNWIRYSEYVDLVYDTETDTMEVVKPK
jgi:hypothetical protein